MLGVPFVWRPRGELYEAVITGRPAFNGIFGESFFGHLAEHPDDAAVFNAAMSAGSSAGLSAILDAYDFSRFQRIVDVGGGHGSLLHGILSANPQVRGLLFDLPVVIAGAAALRTGAVAARGELTGGDFFETVPEGADAYILRGIIHDWGDEDALKILKNCRSAIHGHDGRLLLIGSVHQPASGSGSPQEIFDDLMMLTLLGGRERTESDFGALLGEAGFAHARIIPTAGAGSIIECRAYSLVN